MNRLLTANGPCADFATRATSVAFLSWLVLTTSVSAQLPLPPGTSVAQTQSVMSSEQLMNHVRTAIGRKDYKNAVELFRHAAASAANSPQQTASIERLRAELIAVGFDKSLLSMPPKTPLQALLHSNTAANSSAGIQRLPSVQGAQPIGNPSTADITVRKREALRLVAIGRAALDRGDASTALTLAKQANELNVPEREFAAGEPRVWQLLLDAESAARRSGVALTSGMITSSSAGEGVRQAGGTSDDVERGTAAQTLFNQFAGEGQSSGIRQVQNEQPLPNANTGATVEAGYAERVYNEGLEALTQGDKSAAREKFLEAWKYESSLDIEKRRQLKDKLTLLQPGRLGVSDALTSDKPMTAIERAELESQEKTRRLYREVTAELAAANETKTTAPLDTLDQLDKLKRRVESADLDESARRSLVSMVDGARRDQQSFIEANRAQIDLDLRNESVRQQLATESQREAHVDDEIASLVETFNQMIEDRRFNEAEVIAKQVNELKPGSPIAITMFHNARMQVRRLMDQEVRDLKEDAFVKNMIDVERAAVGINPDLNYEMPEARVWEDLSRRRLADAGGNQRLSIREQEIQRALMTDVNVKYTNRPLHEVLDDLSAMTGVPIVMDNRALSAVRVTPDTPVGLTLAKSIPLKSALNLILGNLELTYVIDNDVLSITSIEAKRSKVRPRTYRVADLVTPIPNFPSTHETGLVSALRSAYQMTSPSTDVQIMPVSAMDLGAGIARGRSSSQMNPDMLGQFSPGGGQMAGYGGGNQSMAAGGMSFADFGSLMQLIQTTVAPETWELLGGPSTMAPYPQNLSLVISTTSDVHDQIADLLDTLRRLQNLQITIEVRFITLSDTFFEQIGVDFDVQFDDNASGLPNDDSGNGVTIGWDGGAGLPTADLDIRFNNNSFGAVPPFSAPDPGALSTIGFAILSDIEAFFFLQAAQGDNRSNVMQAPKVTLFDGQMAMISDFVQRPFVTSIQPVVGDFAVAQQPVIVVLQEGTQLNVHAVVSEDKRFVRMTLVPLFSHIDRVDTFTFEGRRTSRSRSRATRDTNNDGEIDEDDEESTDDIVEGTTVQQPSFAQTSVTTTVSVPDGGTILLGGIKRLSEGRVERGVPFLSKIPYVSRLFRNVATGRDARSLMLMVTPRIIIQEEEEIAQTGFDPNR